MEENQLSMVNDSIEEMNLNGQKINVGINELKSFIEDKMWEHTTDKIPEMRFHLKEELEKCREELDKIGREPLSPARFAEAEVYSICHLLDATFEEYMPTFRCCCEGLANNVLEIDMNPLGIDDDEAKATQLFCNYGDHAKLRVIVSGEGEETVNGIYNYDGVSDDVSQFTKKNVKVMLCRKKFFYSEIVQKVLQKSIGIYQMKMLAIISDVQQKRRVNSQVAKHGL